MAKNEGVNPGDWSLGDKTRLVAPLYDYEDMEGGIFDQHQVQDDLRKVADIVDLCRCRK